MIKAPASAPGKFILAGEHSIVYRGRAIALPLLNTELKYWETDEAPALFVNGEKKETFHYQKVCALREHLGFKDGGPTLHIETQIPLGGGLGSSAALCTALGRYHAAHLSPEQLARLALEGEKFFHAKSSGIDPFTIAIGKAIVFRSQTLEWKELDLQRFHDEGLTFVLADSGLRHKTPEVLERVSHLKAQDPLIFEDLIDALSTNVEGMLKALAEGPRKMLGRLMNDSHFRLIQLGVSEERLDDLQAKLLKLGALGAKLTGAGRGGFILSLFEQETFASLKAQFPVPYLEWKRC